MLLAFARRGKDDFLVLKITARAWGQWLMPIILATHEAEIRRIEV
jgi:hypothetical protein